MPSIISPNIEHKFSYPTTHGNVALSVVPICPQILKLVTFFCVLHQQRTDYILKSEHPSLFMSPPPQFNHCPVCSTLVLEYNHNIKLFSLNVFVTCIVEDKDEAPTSYTLPMEIELEPENTIYHPSFHIALHGGAHLAKGQIGNALALDGSGQYVDLGDHHDSCLGDLSKCKEGLLISFFVKPLSLDDDSYLMDGGPFSVFFKDNKLFTTFMSQGYTWSAASTELRENKWYYIRIYWNKSDGIKLMINGKEVSTSIKATYDDDEPETDNHFYIGKPGKAHRSGRYARALVDELQLERPQAQSPSYFPGNKLGFKYSNKIIYCNLDSTYYGHKGIVCLPLKLPY